MGEQSRANDILVGQPVAPAHISMLLLPDMVVICWKACAISSKYVCVALSIAVPCQKGWAATSLKSESANST